ncbi:MAG: HAD family hydrolase [Chloroflexota bacterium]
MPYKRRLGPGGAPGTNRFARSWPKASEGGHIPAEENVRWVCLDVGETLIDETRVWSTWADVLGVTQFTFMAALGAVIAKGEDHRKVFEILGRPDWHDLRPEFAARYGGFRLNDLYPDALPALGALRDAGYRIAILANQPIDRTAELKALGVDVDLLAMSDELGVHKPSPEFYARALELMAAEPWDIAYVGDRLDNDVLPSLAAGMHPVWLKRGPWGVIVDDAPPVGTLVVWSLTELVERIAEVWTVPVATVAT